MSTLEKPHNESLGVILRAFVANLGIAVAKFVAAAMTGSSAMLTEGIHSLVDTTNQLLLYHGQRRAVRPPDDLHPAGYGREQYFWSFVVAELVFTLGAGVAIIEGIDHFRHPSPTESPKIALAVLGLAFILESWSLVAAVREFRQQGKGRGFVRELKASTDTTTLSVLLEDTGAVIGLLLAASGILLARYTGDPRWDAAASIAIGLVLGLAAIVLLTKAKHLLIGQTADPEIAERVRTLVKGQEDKGIIKDILTIQEAVGRVVCVVSIDFDESLSSSDVERESEALATAIARNIPEITRFYVSPAYAGQAGSA